MQMQQPELLTIDEVARLVRRGKSSIYRDRASGGFIPGVKVGPRAIRWRKADVLAWLERRPTAA